MKSALYALLLVCNVLLVMTVSSSLLTRRPLKTEGLQGIFKDAPGDSFEYVLKRHSVDNHRSEDPDSKDRRSNNVGSSFIRYGRSDPDPGMHQTYNEEDNLDGNSKVNRYPRFKSPDIVIRFGRSGYKNGEESMKRGRNDLNFIRYGRNVPQTYPVEIDTTTMCAELLSTEQIKELLHPYEAKLLRLCNVLNNIDVEHKSFGFIQDSKHD